MEEEWSCYRGGHFNGGKKVMLQLVSVGRENGYVTDLASLMVGEWSCYSLMEGEWSFYRGGQFNGGSMVMLQRWTV